MFSFLKKAKKPQTIRPIGEKAKLAKRLSDINYNKKVNAEVLRALEKTKDEIKRQVKKGEVTIWMQHYFECDRSINLYLTVLNNIWGFKCVLMDESFYRADFRIDWSDV